ncbi:glycosyltransferase [Limimaricola litoreus]|uniref:Glycosyltransferase n=1 Tax=Limimaricola litoreus TaxID=2955316 RepID=A0A9X2FQN1_9RHOB|nr:glycosyltransferase [Limimaricola litoreus]MCP1168250.1 glycosyltransferase [Limimaricola litoreus]
MRPRPEIFDHRAVAAARAVVIIPACNEAERIGVCLDALAAQEGREVCAIHVCVNNSRDDTAGIIRERARHHALPLVLSEVWLPSGGVGRARRWGHAFALRDSPAATALLSTDADCVAMPGWLGAMRRALESHPAVLGRIEPLNDLPPDLARTVRRGGEIEDSYMRLSMELALLLSGDGPDAIGLNTAGGANMGIRRDVYRAVGGFRPLPCREDRELIDRVLAAGHRPARIDAARVRASMRPDGRAPGGMADKIARRLAGRAASFDTALLPVAAMLSGSSGGPAYPSAPLSPAQAAREMPLLAAHVERLRRIGCPVARRRYLSRFVDRA